MAYLKLQLFRAANNVDWDKKWFTCNQCGNLLSAPIYIADEDRYHCQECQDNMKAGMRNRSWESVLSKCVYPCCNPNCCEWLSHDQMKTHAEMCDHSYTTCTDCTTKLVSDWHDWKSHFLQSHKSKYTEMDLIEPVVKIDVSKRIGMRNLFVGKYLTNLFCISLNLLDRRVQLCVARFPYNDNPGNSREFKAAICFDGVTCKKFEGEYVGVKQLMCSANHYKTIDVASWRTAQIEIVFNNNDMLTRIAECSICMNAMTTAIVPCKNGHQVCHVCAPNIRICPICRGEMTKVTLRVPDLFTNMHVACPHAHQGCLQVCNVGDVENHAQNCDYQTMKCPECELCFPIIELSNHLSEQHEMSLRNNAVLKADNKGYLACMGSVFRVKIVEVETDKYVVIVTMIHAKNVSKNKRFICRLEWTEGTATEQLADPKEMLHRFLFVKDNNMILKLQSEKHIDSVRCMICPSNTISWCK